jgi:tetratricopeptide (TPR) repeat protein
MAASDYYCLVQVFPAPYRTKTTYSCAHRAILFASIVHVLAAATMARAPAAPPVESGISMHQTSCGTSSAAAGKSGKQIETVQLGTLEEAKSFLQRGLLTQAENATRQFLHSHADSAEGHYLLGHILFDEVREKYVGEEEKQGESFRYNDSVEASLAATRDAKARESLSELSAGARYHPPDALDLKTVGLNYLLLNDLPLAEKWLTASVTLNPQDAQAWFFLGRTKYSETKYVGAIEAFAHCLKIDPENAEAEYNVGLSYEGLNQNDEAIQAYQNAIAWEAKNGPRSPDPFVGLGRLYLHQNQPEKALSYLEPAVAAFPQVGLAHEELGKAYSVLLRLPEAQRHLETAAKLSPQKASVRCLLGQVYQQQKMTAKAQAEFERCTILRNTESGHMEAKQSH